MLRTVTMDFNYMNLIPAPPGATPTQMYSQACQNDKVTVETWRNIWIGNAKSNKQIKGSWKANGLGEYYNKHKFKPAILVGAGPSLRYNVDELKNIKDIPIFSVLHNYHFLEDRGIKPDYYVTLDCQNIVIDEIAEGGKRTLDEYFETTVDKKLIAFVGSPPDLIKRWKGEVIFFNCPIPDEKVLEEIDATERFWTYVSTGGNVLGATAYVARLMGCSHLAFMGADFSFSYETKFHGWDSKYDKNLGTAMRAIDVWGNGVFTWQSYFNFKVFFDWLSQNVLPGTMINCTQGGIMGAYPEGIIQTLPPMDLSKFLSIYSFNEALRDQCENPETTPQRKILY